MHPPHVFNKVLTGSFIHRLLCGRCIDQTKATSPQQTRNKQT